MRQWLFIGTLTVACGCIGGYLYFSPRPTTVRSMHGPKKGDEKNLSQHAKNDGGAEQSEVIEPLIVDRGFPAATVEPPREEAPTPRVTLTPGMVQPPRPDAEPGRVRRMPFADEEEILAFPLDPVIRILQSPLPPLNLFDDAPEK